MKPQTVGICLVSRDNALREDVQSVLDRLNHWLGHETPRHSQQWPDGDPHCLYRQVAGQAQAYVSEHAAGHELYLDLRVFDDAQQAHSSTPCAPPKRPPYSRPRARSATASCSMPRCAWPAACVRQASSPAMWSPIS